MSRLYGPKHRALQDRFDSRRMADRIEQIVVKTEIDDLAKAFIESRDMFFLATADQNGRPLGHRFHLVKGRFKYRPRIADDGSYSMKLAPGLYEISFTPYNCSEYSIKNFRMYERSRTLDLTVDCPQ